MKVSPLDLRQLRFRTTFRGFDKAEVLALIAEVTDDYENALSEVDRLRQEVSKMEALLNQHREHERDLRDTLMTAQRVSDDIRANAEAQARNIIREAEGRSDLLLQKTQARLEDVQREIDGMKMKRREVETTLESTIASSATRSSSCASRSSASAKKSLPACAPRLHGMARTPTAFPRKARGVTIAGTRGASPTRPPSTRNDALDLHEASASRAPAGTTRVSGVRRAVERYFASCRTSVSTSTCIFAPRDRNIAAGARPARCSSRR